MNIPMYHPDSKEPVNVHPTQVESMKSNGWKTEPPAKPKPKPDEVDNG